MNRKPSIFESIATHVALMAAVAFSLYPILWVISIAFSGRRPPEARVLPLVTEPTTAHLTSVVASARDGHWLFGQQLAN